MSLISTGFDGSVQEPEMAQILAMTSFGGTVLDPASWRVTAIAGNRRVAIAPGTGYDSFVYATEAASTLLDLVIPTTQTSGGRWFLICAERDWTKNTTRFVALLGSANSLTSAPKVNNASFWPGASAAAPIQIPRVNPSGFQNTPGRIKHQAIAWVYATVGSTGLEVIDLRRVPAKGVRVNAASRLIDSARVSGGNTVTAGTNRVFMTFNITVDEFTPFLFVAAGRWAANGNAAGSHWLEHNGTTLGLPVRAHNDGLGTMPQPFYFTVPGVLVPGGVNTLRFIVSAETNGANRSVADVDGSFFEV